MESLLKDSGLQAKYSQIFKDQGMTLDRFEKMISISEPAVIDTLMKNCCLTSGDFIDLVTTWEGLKERKRQNFNSNSKVAANLSQDTDLCHTPVDQIRNGNLNFYTESIVSYAESDSQNTIKQADLFHGKSFMCDRGTQTEGDEVKKSSFEYKPVMIGQKRSMINMSSFATPKLPMSCNNKKRVEKIMQKSQAQFANLKSRQNESQRIFQLPESSGYTRPQTPTFVQNSLHCEGAQTMKFDEEVYFGKKQVKPVAILTNNLSTSFYNTNDVFKNTKYNKIMISKTQNINRFLNYQSQQLNMTTEVLQQNYKEQMNLDFKGIENCNLKSSIDYLQNEKKFKFILIEMGVSTMHQYYMMEDPNDNPADTLFLSLLIGKMSSEFMGPPFPNIGELSRTFKLQSATKPIKTNDGMWICTTWKKKSIQEYQKYSEQLKLTSKDEIVTYLEQEKQKRIEKYQMKQEGKGEKSSIVYAGQSPHFDRKKYKYLSDKEFQKRKPKF